MVQDRDIVTMEDEYEIMYGLSNGMIAVYHLTANTKTLSILQGYLSIAIPFANRICVQHYGRDTACRMGLQ